MHRIAERRRPFLQCLSVLAVASSLLFVGCSDDDADNGGSSTGGSNAAGSGSGGKGGSNSSSAGKGGSSDSTSGGAGGKTSSAANGGKGGSKSAQGGEGGASGGNGNADSDAGTETNQTSTDTPTTPTKGLYAIANELYNPDNSSTTYVSTFDSLDITALDMDKAREIAGRADVLAYDGHVFITSSESPTIKRYTVGDDGKLNDEKTISFASLGQEMTARMTIAFISPDKAYIGFDSGFAIWNPTEMTLGGQIEVKDANLPLMRGEMSLSSSSAIVRGDRMYIVYYWIDWSTYTYAKEQFIGVFDTKNDKLLMTVSEERCPGLSANPQLDEDGNIYLSPWFYNVPSTLTANAPHGCAVRIPKDADKPDDWTLKFNEIAGGHEGAQLSYISKGRALFSVLREDNLKITSDTSPFDITSSVNWETWTVDLKDTSSAKAVDGIALGVSTQLNETVDGRTFVFIPGMDFDTVKVFEVLPDAKSRAAFDFKGSTFAGFVKIK